MIMEADKSQDMAVSSLEAQDDQRIALVCVQSPEKWGNPWYSLFQGFVDLGLTLEEPVFHIEYEDRKNVMYLVK